MTSFFISNEVNFLLFFSLLIGTNFYKFFKLENKDFSHADLYDFFVKYIESKKTENGNNFNINLKGKSVYADFNKESFTELLDQLISNAKRHAFKENSTDYKIDFNINQI